MAKSLLLVLALFLSTVVVFAQSTTSSLIGTVSGPDGVLPGATVVVKDNKTSKEATVTTDSVGGFKVPNLEIGFYTVTVTAPGFKTFSAEEVKLEVGKDYNLTPRLEIGAISESVTVTAGTDIVNSTDGKLNGTVSNRQLTELPLLTRNPLNFVTLQAGVASNPFQQSTINGVRTSATNITIEGVNVQDNFIRANATDFSPARPIVDEVEEFSISSQANVEDGFGSGQIQFPIRRGGNRFAGSIWEYNRNSALAANSFFNNRGNVARPYRNRNEFGGRFAGPLPFFHFGEGGPLFESGKDRLFFFVLYQKTIDRIPVSRLATTLTNNARQGLFTYTAGCTTVATPTTPACPAGITPNQLVTVNLFNPAFNTGITGINPLIQSRFLGSIPAPNSVDTGDQRVTTGYRFNQNGNQEQTNYTTRIDYKVNDKNSVKGIYRYVFQTLQSTAADGTFNINPNVNQPSHNPFFSTGLNSTFSSNFTNELNGGLSISDPTFKRVDGVPPNIVTLPLVTAVENTFLTQGRKTKAYNLQDNAGYISGNHSIRFGGQMQVNRIRSFNNGNGVGSDIIAPVYSLGVGTNTPQISTAQFTNTTLFPGTVPTAQRASANALLALLGGIVNGANQAYNVTSQTSGFVPGATNGRKYLNEQYAAYVSDQWRIRQDLTLNFGVRYDYYTPVRSGDGLFFEPVIADGVDPVQALLNPSGSYRFVGGNAGKANTFYKGDKNNFSPNISIAYSPRRSSGFGKYLLGEGKTVFRGGYRISYINDELFKSVINAGVGNAGLLQNVAALNPATGTTALNARINNLPVIPTPVFNPNRTYQTNDTAAFNFFGTVYGIDPNIRAPRVQEFNFGVQREIGFNSVLEVRYVGTRSKDLLRAVDLNQIDIRSNGFAADFNRARANFVLTGNAACTTAGCQPLTVFPTLAGGGLLTNSTITGQLVAGTPADLALIYIQNGLTGNVRFLANPSTGVADYLNNGASSNYDGLQVELRRRFAHGLLVQANYTFSKNLTDSQGAQTNGTGDTQNRFDPLLDNLNPSLEFGRAITDQTHKFNLNAIYELPFGKGHTFFNEGGWVDKVVGGFQISAIVQIGSGAPVTFTDARGTLNRAGRSSRQTAVTSLTKQELKALVGIYTTPNGIFFLPPAVLGRNPDGTINTAIGGTGRGANGFGSATFTGQMFFNNAPGTTSGLERNVVNGPRFYNLDMTLAKQIKFGERYSFRVEASMFNALNRTNFAPGQSLDINSSNFGVITQSLSPRVVQVAGRFSF
ncbi:MAG: carboxypeptidase regulatory-like domain-containing protein [Pyrinomonadaceae bacterium]